MGVQIPRTAARITAVCIFLNEERFLREAVDSVIAQDCPDWELVLVDDGSIDGSTDIARSLVQEDSRIFYLDHAGHSNRGMSASRNAGVAAGSGEFVTFIDADDRWPTDKLTRQIAVMEQHPDIALAAGAIRYWESWRGGVDRIEHCGSYRDRVTNSPDALLNVYPLGNKGGAAVSAMIRRAAYDQVGGFEESFTGFYEDQAFFAKIYAHAPVMFSSEVWLDYRQHPGSCCAQTVAAGLHAEKRGAMLDWLESYFSGLNVDWQGRALAAVRHQRRRLQAQSWLGALKSAGKSALGRN